MPANQYQVREIQHSDTEPLCDYWFGADPEFLAGMGVDPAKMPKRDEWKQMLNDQISQPYEEKQSYCIIWLLNDEPVGHSNVNRIIYGEEAYMHLHIWKEDNRIKGMGVKFIQMTLPCFFVKMKLKKICCEPYALNPAPYKVLEKAGFEFIKEYVTVPGWINFEQPVKHWELDLERFKELYHKKNLQCF